MNFIRFIWGGQHFINTPTKEEGDGAHRKEHNDESRCSHGIAEIRLRFWADLARRGDTICCVS